MLQLREPQRAVAWASAAIFAITGSWDIAWRLPSFLTAVIPVTSLFRAAIAAYGAAAASIALGAFGLNLLSVRLAILVRTDMPLTLVIFLLGLLIWQKIRAREWWEMFALLTASMFIKGPIVFAFLLPSIVLFQWLAGKRSGANAWCGWWPWIASVALFSVWVICGIKVVPGFYEQVVMKEFLGRFSQTVHRPQPVLFYLPHLLEKFAPWSVLILALGVLSFRRTRSGIRNLFRQTTPDILWLVCWSLGGLVVMSLVPSKRVDRIYPVVPPLACCSPRRSPAAFEQGKLMSASCNGAPRHCSSRSCLPAAIPPQKCCPIIVTTPIISRLSAAR